MSGRQDAAGYAGKDGRRYSETACTFASNELEVGKHGTKLWRPTPSSAAIKNHTARSQPDDIRRWIADGRLNAQSLAREENDTEWRPLSAFPEFADALAAGYRPAAA